MKSQIFNLIILDESGSMQGVTQQTIDGCNETINTIAAAQEQYADTQEHFVSIYAFQDGHPSRYIIKNEPVARVKHITPDDYMPYGSTPLFDAVGSTLADLKVTTQRHSDAIGSVTIITDGYENASRHYSLQQVAKMISALKEMGWNFNFVGANIDVEKVSSSLNIDNAMAFEQDATGTNEMFRKHMHSSRAYYDRVEKMSIDIKIRLEEAKANGASQEEIDRLMDELRKVRGNASRNFFDQ